MQRSRPEVEAVFFGGIYLLLACAGIGLTRFNGGVAFISIANAILLARLLTLPRRDWLPSLVACAIAGAIATSTVGLGQEAALPLVIVNTSETLLAAVMLGWLSRRSSELGSHATLPWFLAIGGFAAPAAGAIGGAAVATYVGADSYLPNWFNWFAGHALGTITFTPIAVHLIRGDVRRWLATTKKVAIAEAGVHLLLVATVSALVFGQEARPMLFLPMLPIILAIFRSGRLPAALAIVVLTIVSGALTVAGHGPVSALPESFGVRLQFLQFYLACTVLTVLPIAAELARRASMFQRMHDSEARYRVLMENSSDIILNVDTDGRVRFASPSINQMGGFDHDSIIGRRATDLMHAADVDAFLEAHLRAMADPAAISIVEFRVGATGQDRWYEATIRAVVDDDRFVLGAVSAVRDVNHRKEAEARLSKVASTDHLTGLHNRRALDALLFEAIATAEDKQGGCLALFDLDHFKSINDRYGHTSGDAVLKHFAMLAKCLLRDGDHIARFGGEEFAVILPGASLEQARLVCERIRVAFAASSVSVEGELIGSTVSGGVARYSSASFPAVVLNEAIPRFTPQRKTAATASGWQHSSRLRSLPVIKSVVS